MNFTKMQGAGNDFILIDGGASQLDWSQVARAICDRHYGVGGDGLLLVLPSSIADFRVRIFNSDGSEAETCGNGLRCVAKYALNKGFVNSNASEISIETISGVRKAKLYTVGDRVTAIQVSMGKPKFGAGDIPVAVEQGGNIVDMKPIMNYPVIVDGRELLLNLVSTGNPHAVYFSHHPVSDFPLYQLGPKIEHHEIFPKRVNFEVARVVNRKQIEARVWEAGVGETLACGSGACAIAVIAKLQGFIDSKVDIMLKGGLLAVEWDGVGEVYLSGPAEIVFSGDWA